MAVTHLRDDMAQTIRFAHANVLRAQAEELRADNIEIGLEDLENMEEKRKVVRECHANLLDLQAAFVELYGMRALEEI